MARRDEGDGEAGDPAAALTSRAWALLLCCALVWLAMARLAQAQSGARELFDAAVEALRRGEYAQARDLFAESLDASPTPSAAYDLAVACRGTGETTRAEGVLQALLADAYGALDDTERADATALLEAVRAEQAVVVVVVSAPDATVRVDGVRVEAGATVHLDAGEHVVVLAADGYVEEERRARLERGETRRLEVVLTPRAVGTLALEAPADDLVVEIVGVARGSGRIERELPTGEYVVRVSRDAARRESTVRVDGGRTTRFRFDDPSAGIDLLREPAFWIVGAVLLVGAGVGTALGVVYGQPVAPPVSDPEYGVIQALSVPF